MSRLEERPQEGGEPVVEVEILGTRLSSTGISGNEKKYKKIRKRGVHNKKNEIHNKCKKRWQANIEVWNNILNNNKAIEIIRAKTEEKRKKKKLQVINQTKSHESFGDKLKHNRD